LSSTEYGVLVLDVFGGIGALLIGIGVLVGMLALAKTLARVRTTLDGVDRQLENIGTPVTSTLTRVDEVTKSLENTADTVSRTADLTKSAVQPAIINIGATLSGVTAAVRRLFTGQSRRARES
jgi:uncharacterized protein YoxC